MRKVWDALPGQECELRLMADGILGLEKEYRRKHSRCAEMDRPRSYRGRMERLRRMRANRHVTLQRSGCPNCSFIVANLHGATESNIAEWRHIITGAYDA